MITALQLEACMQTKLENFLFFLKKQLLKNIINVLSNLQNLIYKIKLNEIVRFY